MSFKYDVFLICPVRGASEGQKAKMHEYIQKLEDAGKKVYYPAKDTDQNDSIGLRICTENVAAIKEAAEVHIYYDPNSTGTLFDLGAAFAANKKLVIANIDDLAPTPGKSFTNMMIAWSQR